jgi:hypothetical protein
LFWEGLFVLGFRLLLSLSSLGSSQLSNPSMGLTTSRRTAQLYMNPARQSAATRALIRSHPLTYRYPRGRSVYVAVPQTAPFARGSSCCSR